MSTFKPPRAIRMLAKYGSEALAPKLVRVRSVSIYTNCAHLSVTYLLRQRPLYMGPLVSKRIAANVRKRAIYDGTFGTFSEKYGSNITKSSLDTKIM